jgi:hypothetical protein
MSNGATWTYFIAHAGPDRETASSLAGALKRRDVSAFFSGQLDPGDHWDERLPLEQRSSSATVVLVSRHSGEATFLLEEVQRAIQLSRETRNAHRVIPAYLEGWPSTESEVIYGLTRRHGLSLPEVGGIEGLAERLARLSAELHPGAAPALRSAVTALGTESSEAATAVARLKRIAAGPPPEFDLVSGDLVDVMCEHVPPHMALLAVGRAVALLKEAFAGEPRLRWLRPYELPPPASVSSSVFWSHALFEARLYGPRMVAAVVLAVLEGVSRTSPVPEGEPKLLLEGVLARLGGR